MKYSALVKKTASHTPVISRILREKRELYERNQQQKKQITELKTKNDKLEAEITRRSRQKIRTIWPLLEKEIILATNTRGRTHKSTLIASQPFSINWVVPAVMASSGGQSDIFRTIKYLREQGHNCRIYIFDPHERSNITEQRQIIAGAFPGLEKEVAYNAANMKDCDIIFATHWMSAYPVYNFRGKGRKYYFAQGYEPHTQPAGYLSYLAEQTYSFGFRGVTLGQWLAEKLSKEYKMKCDYFDFGYDPTEYFKNSNAPRKDILYYAQPQKGHRGFELGMMALKIFHSKQPNSKIHLFGADLRNYEIPFPYEDEGILTVHQLNELYNQCAAGLALSFTNISLIPIEMIAAGCQPVVNEADHNHKIRYANLVSYAEPNPEATAKALIDAVGSNKNGLSIKLPEEYSWDYSNQQVESILIQDFSKG